MRLAVLIVTVVALALSAGGCGASRPAPSATSDIATAHPHDLPIEEWARLTRPHRLAPASPRPRAGTGRITGRVTDAKTGEPMPGVTVVATSAALQITDSAITDETGRYVITNLDSSTYTVQFFFADLCDETSASVLAEDKTVIDHKIDTTKIGTPQNGQPRGPALIIIDAAS